LSLLLPLVRMCQIIVVLSKSPAKPLAHRVQKSASARNFLAMVSSKTARKSLKTWCGRIFQRYQSCNHDDNLRTGCRFLSDIAISARSNTTQKTSKVQAVPNNLDSPPSSYWLAAFTALQGGKLNTKGSPEDYDKAVITSFTVVFGIQQKW